MHNKKLYNWIINSISKVVKKQINEAFDFDSVNKSKKSTNIYSKFYEILGKSYSEITEEDKDFINLFPDGIYKVSDKDELKKIIKRSIRLLGYDCNLNWIDVSDITDMSNLFQNTKFNGDISRWDVSNVTDMKEMFWRSEFDGDISRWDVSNVTNMQGMFMNSLFNGDINNWDVSNVTNMHCMFHNTEFNNDISHWDVSNVIYMSGMFDNTSFNKDISNWKINPNCKIDFIFADCPIKEQYKPKQKNRKIHESFEFDKVNKRKTQINYYELLPNIIEKIKQFKNLTDNDYNILIQYNAVYKVSERDKLVALIDYFTEQFGNECNLNWIDVSNVTDMSRLFMQSSFNGDISKWDVSNVTDMSQIFDSCPFSGDISQWDVSNVTTMEMMFFYSGFNNDISHWDVSNVTEYSGIFTECPIEEQYKNKKFRL